MDTKIKDAETITPPKITNLPVTQARPKSVTIDMADRYCMEVEAFERTLRATVFPGTATKEDFAAFLLIARDYNLNPLAREIFAFPKKGGGIQPIVSVDGWSRIINNQAAFDGMEFVDHFDKDGKLVAITCKMFRKDRGHPTEVTEYMVECVRPTDTWRQWPARMLRHKTMIQCARYAFAISGIQEQDEYERGQPEVYVEAPPRPRRSDFDQQAPIDQEAPVENERVEPIEAEEPATVFTVTSGDGEVVEYASPVEAANAFITWIGLAERMGEKALEGLWESNTLSGALRDAGFPEIADKVHDEFKAAMTRAIEKRKAAKKADEPKKEDAKPIPAIATPTPVPMPLSKYQNKNRGVDWDVFAKALIEHINATPKEELRAFLERFARELEYFGNYKTKTHDAIQAAIDAKN